MENQKHSILYVDDELVNLNVFKATFRRDYDIFTANSAQEAMEILRQQAIDLIISDQRMPKMTGVEFLKWTLAEYPHAIRIILTGFSDTEAIIRAINECDIHRYITKPWDIEEMRLALKKASETFQLRRDNVQLLADLKEAKELLEQKVAERTKEVIRQKEEIELKNQILEAQNSKLQELDNERNSIISMIVHDLQSPINRISGLLELLEVEGKNNFNHNQLTYMELLRKSIADASRHIRNLLDTKALEGDNSISQVVLSKIDLIQLIGRLLESYKEQASRKQVVLNYETSHQEVYIKGYEDYLSRIFDNLISNAIKFSPKNVNSNVFIKVKENGEYVRVSVQDEGQGLSEEDKKNLFKKFQKLSARPTNGESSSGLGLSIVKSLTEQLQGRVWAEGEPKKGATFIVEFPKYSY
ncbi:hybrid sensor histidine kinase/response regulator [Thermoflexibacter ruber]|uniref:histidine kinase n=1 Tax=Thermoflexibacter ruber TaxID=1003 RepID=A0A1I2FD39_9BACT|nr:hybrid sensor histidine kinase/response regulator [Thermoflexibacter ruber]SFF02668.1 Signal transduction histidine kinase [Thermoflexibacter ruber]